MIRARIPRHLVSPLPLGPPTLDGRPVGELGDRLGHGLPELLGV